MEKLTIIRIGIRNTEKALAELEKQLEELRTLEKIAEFEQEADKALEEDFPL